MIKYRREKRFEFLFVVIEQHKDNNWI